MFRSHSAATPVVKWGLMSDEEINEAAQEEMRAPLPPASFAFLVLSLRAQAEMQLGLMRFSEEDKEEPNLQLARHSIDLMGMLQEKTKGNLELDERRLLENSLTELRFRFVQVSDEVAKAAAQKT
jgi:hypothetical protein